MELKTLKLKKIDYNNSEDFAFIQDLENSTNMEYLWDLTNINDTLDNKDGMIVLNSDDEKIGYLNLTEPTEARFGKTVSIYYATLEKYRNNGYAKKLLKEVSDYLFNQMDIDCIVAEVNIENIASQKVLLKSGFEIAYKKDEDMRFIRVRK